MRIFEVNYALGMMDVSPNKSPPRSSEMRAVINDFIAKFKGELVSAFKARRNPDIGNNIFLKDYCWLFFDFFSKESGLKFMRKDATGAEVELTRDNSLEFFIEKLEAYFFSYLRIDTRLHSDKLEVPLSFDFFWIILFYLVEAKHVGYQYLKPGTVSTDDTKDSLRKTLEEYKSKLDQAKDPQIQIALRHTISFLQQQIDKLSEPQRKAENKLKETEGSWRKALKEIFIFYSKQQKVAKVGGTFDSYKDDNKSLSAGEWLRFCKDFNLNPQLWQKRFSSMEEKEKYEKLLKEVNTSVSSFEADSEPDF